MRATAQAIRCDVTNELDVGAAFAEARQTFGPVAILINNAGAADSAPFVRTSLELFRRMLDVNLIGTFLCSRAALPDMLEAGFGRIVNISSRAQLGKTHRTAYAGTKGGLLAMGRCWALEHARDGVTVNAIAPGPIRTELFDTVNPPDMPRTAEIIESIPVGRIGLPEDIANAAAFFMDEKSGYVTGQTLYVCGGVTLTRGGS
jgi:NAD(P)-dependent dehydrogenase (short-subunit alcohol dehydrogenase family)